MRLTFDSCEKKHCHVCLLSVITAKRYSGSSTVAQYYRDCSLRPGGWIEGDDIFNLIITGKRAEDKE